MSQVPLSAAQDVQEAFSSIFTTLDQLRTQDFQFQGRRVRGASDAALPQDYVTLAQAKALVAAGTATASTSTGPTPIAGNPSGIWFLSQGGTSAALTASNGGIVYSTASAMAILAGTATARQMLQSGANAAPAWSTATWPATTTINQVLYSSAANVVGGLATANYAVLNTSSSGVPSITASPVLSTQLTIGVVGTATGKLILAGTTSGTMTLTVGNAVGGSFTMTLPGGSTDFSATGGTNKFLKQNSAGSAITVVTIAAADLSDGTTGTTTIVLSASPTLTGVPLAPTAAPGTNTTQIATTAFVIANAGGVTSITGTANQVIASAPTGAVTLSTPQNIGTASTPQWGGEGIGVAHSANDQVTCGGAFTGSASTQAYHVSTDLTGVANGDINFLLFDGSVDTAASGTTSGIGVIRINQVTVTNHGATVSNTASLYIANAPSATVTGANYALWVAAGAVRLGALTAGYVKSDANGNLSVDSASGSNGAGFVPWSVVRKPWWCYLDDTNGSSTFITFGPTVSVTGATNQQDATTGRARFTTASGDLQVADIRTTTLGTCGTFQHLPTFEINFFTGSATTTCQIWVGFFDSVANGTAPGTNTSGVLTRVHAAFRFAALVDSTTWHLSTGDGTTQTTADSTVTISTSTQYFLKIRFATSTSVRFSINGGAEQTVAIASSAGDATRMIVGAWITNNGAGFTRFFDCGAMYGDFN